LERPQLAGWALAHLVSASADHVICNSGATRQWLLDLCPKLQARSSVAWNGIQAMPIGEGGDGRKGRPDGNDDVVIGLVGRINAHKGHSLLLQALERLHDAGERRPRLVFAGDTAAGADGCWQGLAARIAASPIAGRVEALGFVAQTAPLYASLDIVCVPSTCAEGFGLVAVEAMAAGKPVVAADLGGLREVVDPGVTGWLHRPGDAADLAACLARLINDASLRLAMGQRGRERFERHFTLNCMRQRLAATFAGIGSSLPA
jgi:glycosyltransferase involved in cell wall biosynthesis